MKFWNSKRMENYEFICYYIFKNVLKKSLIYKLIIFNKRKKHSQNITFNAHLSNAEVYNF